MARPNKRSALATLSRTRLLEMAQGFGLPVRTNDSKAEIVDAIAHSKRASFERVLALLMREELKEICRAHGLDDSGKLKQAIVDRILGKEDAPQLPGVFEEGDEPLEAADGPPTLASVLGVLRKAQLVSLAADYPIVLDGAEDKPTLVRLLVAAEGISLPQVLELQGRFDLKKICTHHGLTDDGRDRDGIIARILAASPSYAPPTETSAPAMDAVLQAPATQAVIPGLHHVPEAPPAPPPSAPAVALPPLDASAVPEPGDLVLVRHRQYLVEAVHRSQAPDEMTRIEAVCLDDDNQGRKLEVLWELELGARRLDPATRGLGQIARLDPPRHFAAYLHAVKWNCVTATNARLFQAPFRAGIQILQHQLAPRVLSRFMSQGYSQNDLTRVTMVRTRYTVAARVLAFGRLSLFGRGATRLHDRVIPLVAPWLEGKGKMLLRPFASDADREALVRFEDALARPPSWRGSVRSCGRSWPRARPRILRRSRRTSEPRRRWRNRMARAALAARGESEAAAPYPRTTLLGSSSPMPCSTDSSPSMPNERPRYDSSGSAPAIAKASTRTMTHKARPHHMRRLQRSETCTGQVAGSRSTKRDPEEKSQWHSARLLHEQKAMYIRGCSSGGRRPTC